MVPLFRSIACYIAHVIFLCFSCVIKQVIFSFSLTSFPSVEALNPTILL